MTIAAKSRAKPRVSKTKSTKSAKITSNAWDLSALFKSEAQLQSFSNALNTKAKAFNKRYQGKLASVESSQFLSVIKEYEALSEGIGRIMTYVFLRFAKDSTQGDFYAKYEMQSNRIQESMLFFELEFCKLDSAKKQAIIKAAKHYAYYLQKLIAQDKYTLSLSEEKVLLTTSPVGVGAFARLFDEHLSHLSFKMPKALESSQKANSKDFNKKAKKLSEEEMLALLHHPKREIRKEAQIIFTKKLKKSRHLLSYILNMVRKDVKITKDLRGYKLPESFRHISNDATQKSVDKLVEVTSKHFGIVGEYYKIKAKLLGIKELMDYDRYAPLKTSSYNLPYSEALELVLESFEAFSKDFSAIAKRALKEGWVDSHPMANKRGGAFSHCATPSAHPFVLLNYTNSRRDVFTIAHEFGHMIHQELSKSQGYLNMDTPLTTAETASVFAEMLLFDKLKAKLSKAELIPLYAGKLEDIFSTLFRQIVMTLFEREIHATSDELKAEDFDRIWLKANKAMFGSSLTLSANYASWWCYIPHFIHSPFYCYAYSYGQLLVLALFGLYKAQDSSAKREKFIKTYTNFLSLGGSKSPKALVSAFGLDLEDDRFWLIGIKEVQKMLSEFKALVNATPTAKATI